MKFVDDDDDDDEKKLKSTNFSVFKSLKKEKPLKCIY